MTIHSAAPSQDVLPDPGRAVDHQHDGQELPAAVGNRAAQKGRRDEEERRELVDPHQRGRVKPGARDRAREDQDDLHHQHEVERGEDDAVRRPHPGGRAGAARSGQSGRESGVFAGCMRRPYRDVAARRREVRTAETRFRAGAEWSKGSSGAGFTAPSVPARSCPRESRFG